MSSNATTPPTMPPIRAALSFDASVEGVATPAVAFVEEVATLAAPFVDIDGSSTCCVLAEVDDVAVVTVVLSDIGDEFGVGGIADAIEVTVAVVDDVDCVVDNGADVVVGHTRASHEHLVVEFVEQSC
jgi:hypothetical protein